MSLLARQLHGERGQSETVRDLTLEIASGQITLFSGSPASGHHLLLHLLGLLETPSSGELLLDGASTRTLPLAERVDLRSRIFGYVFANPLLLPTFSLIENIAMPLFKICQLTPVDARARAERWLAFVGLLSAAERPASELSADAQSLAALARALAHEPRFLLVERLDAHRDQQAQLHYISLLQRALESSHLTILISATTRSLAAFTDRVIEMEAGRIRYDSQHVGS